MTRSLDQALLQGADVSAMASANLLVNGFMGVSQEAGTTAVGPGAYPADQWQFYGVTSATAAQINSPFPTMPSIVNGIKISTPVGSALAAGTFTMLAQSIEAQYVQRLAYGSSAAKPVTVAFMVRPSIDIVGGFSLFCQNSGGTNRIFMRRFTAPANQDTLISFLIPGDVAFAIPSSNTLGMQARICFGAGTSYQGTPDQWSGFNALAPADATNLAATTGNTVNVSGVVVLPGIVPITPSMLPFLARRSTDDDRLCRRYWTRNPSGTGLPGSSTQAQGIVELDEAMRSDPTVTILSGTNAMLHPYTAFANLSAISFSGNKSMQFTATGSGFSTNLTIFLLPYKLSFNARM